MFFYRNLHEAVYGTLPGGDDDIRDDVAASDVVIRDVDAVVTTENNVYSLIHYMTCQIAKYYLFYMLIIC